MGEAYEAWRLWHLLQALSDALWKRYESAFMDFCGEGMAAGEYHASDEKVFKDTEQPF